MCEMHSESWRKIEIRGMLTEHTGLQLLAASLDHKY